MKNLLITAALVFAVSACGQKTDTYTDSMADEHAHDSPTANAHTAIAPSTPVTGEWVTIGPVGGNDVRGYLSTPDSAMGPLPALVVIHEWWGLDEHIKAMTDRLAGEGYVALAVDMYNGSVATTPDSAQVFMRRVMGNRDDATAMLTTAVNWLETEKAAPSMGVIGWCFGGAWSLNTALAVPEKIDATVIYYGNLNTDPAALDRLDMPILGIFGAEDQGIPVASVNRFETVLDSLGKDADIHIYEGANHAFANSSGGNYHAEAAADAWEKTVAFLNQHLK